MSTVWKWILGIAIGLVVLAVVAGAGLLIFSRWTGGAWMMGSPAFAPQGRDLRVNPWQGERMPMHPDGWMPHGRFPGTRFGGFSLLPLIFGGLFQLGLLALVVLGVIALARLIWRQPPAPAQPEKISACPSCGSPVQAGWKHCPECGSPQTA